MWMGFAVTACRLKSLSCGAQWIAGGSVISRNVDDGKIQQSLQSLRRLIRLIGLMRF